MSTASHPLAGRMPLIATLLIAAWTVFFLWANANAGEPGTGPERWTWLAAQWSAPVLLVIGLWLLAARQPRAAARGGAELANLERRLAAIDEKLLRQPIALAAPTHGATDGEIASLAAMQGEGGDIEGLVESRFEHLRQQAERFKVELESREADNLSAIRRRADELSKALSAQDIAMRREAGRAMDELQTRFKQMRDETLRLSGELEKVRADALRGWDSAVADLETRMQETAGKVIEVDEGAFDKARERLALLHAEAEQIDAAAAERLQAFQAEIAARRDAALGTGDEALAGLENQLAVFDSQLEERRRAQLARIAELDAQMRETVGKVVEVDENALANARTRLVALHEEAERIDAAARDRLAEFETEIARRRDASLAGGGTALAEFEQQLGAFDKRLDERRVAQLARMSELGERSEAMATRLAEIDGQLAGHVQQAEAASDALARFTGDLSTRLTDSRDLLASSGRTLAEMTEASARMFELVRQSAEQSSQTIPAALVQAQDKLGAFETRALALRDAIAAAEEKGAALASHVDKAKAGVPVSAETLDALGKRLEDLATKSDALAQRTRKELAEAIAELESSTQRMAERLKAGQEAALSEFAATFGERSLEVVGKGLREKTEAALAELDCAAEGAGRTGLETIGQLRTQLAELQEMAGNLEARVAEGRKQVQEEPTKDFSIEMTKIIEKLNGAALDITKIFDAEVPDVAWQAYMRGDYGVFTRKAVRLLSGQRADAIYGHYRSDDDFRETVNRYVRDFESMLRVVLATRNGHQMAVTLLSSDIGKLYVALAQATERLRE